MKQEELIVGRWYSGLERLVGGIGLWNGYVFMGVVFKFGYHSDSAEGFDPANEYEPLPNFNTRALLGETKAAIDWGVIKAPGLWEYEQKGVDALCRVYSAINRALESED